MKRFPLFLAALAIVGLAPQSAVVAKEHKHRDAQPDAVSVGKYPTVTIRSGKVSADKAAGVKYFDAVQREARRVSIRDGLVYDHDGALVRETKSKRHNLNNYVMDAEGNFYLFDEFTTPNVRHSSIFAGGPVAGAGNIQISDGHIVYIDSDSGHYPSTKVFANVLAELRARGVDVGSAAKKP
jgi:hypothetical protein